VIGVVVVLLVLLVLNGTALAVLILRRAVLS
jgi:hypothetical protein